LAISRPAVWIEKLLCLDKWFIEIALQTGYSLTRWHKGIDVMIPKKQDSIRVDKLRTIVLMEPDFNFMNKIIGKRVMNHAEKARSIAPEQFGRRKGKNSIQNAIKKQLATDILRQEKRDFSLITLDAKSCYDRIVQPMAALALKRQGATDSMIRAMFDTISKMERCVRTVYGDSDITYKESNKRHHGILQGNGAGPSIWIMLSSPMLERLKDKGFGVVIQLNETFSILIPAFAFVDDVDLIQEIINEEHQIIQDIVDEWDEALASTGGRLVAEKCRFFMVKHKWANNKWMVTKITDSKVQLSIKDDQGCRQQIKQEPCDKGELALGLMFSPNGNMDDEAKYLRGKTERWGELIRTGHLTKHEAWVALQSTIMKTIEYALPATNMTRKQIDNIMQPVLRSGLAQSGICRNIARDVVYAPNKYLGLGICHPFDIQGINKIESIFNKSQEFTIQLIEASWRRTMIESGYGDNFLEYDMGIARTCIKGLDI
jgi:Reverse transcriptase (RNA-dependent DNA polymerase)